MSDDEALNVMTQCNTMLNEMVAACDGKPTPEQYLLMSRTLCVSFRAMATLLRNSGFDPVKMLQEDTDSTARLRDALRPNPN